MSRQNLCPNPKAKTDTSGWAASDWADGSIITRIDDWAAEGLPTPVLPDGSTVATGFKVTAEHFVQGQSHWCQGAVFLNHEAFADGGRVFVATCLPPDAGTYGLWVSINHELRDAGDSGLVFVSQYQDAPATWGYWDMFFSRPIAGTTHGAFELSSWNSGSIPQSYYFTAMMLEADTSTAGYADGDTDNWLWRPDGTSYELPERLSADEAILQVLQELDASAFPLELPVNAKGQPTRLPAVVFKQVGGGAVYSHDKGPAGYDPLWEFRCWATTYADARRLAQNVITAIDDLGMQMSGMTDDREPETGTPNIIVTASGFFPNEED